MDRKGEGAVMNKKSAIICEILRHIKGICTILMEYEDEEFREKLRLIFFRNCPTLGTMVTDLINLEETENPS